MEQSHHNFPTKAGRLAGVFKKRHPSSLSKKVCPPLGPLCEGDSPQRGEMSRSDRGAWARRAPPAGGGGENCTAARNISGYGKVLSLRPFGAPPSQREVFRHAELPPKGKPIHQKAAASREKKRRLCFGVHAPNISIIPLLLCVIQS